MQIYRQLNEYIYEYQSIEQINSDIQEVSKIIASGNCIVIKEVLTRKYCDKVIQYLENISKSSFPNYFPLNQNTPNHFRLNYEDKRSTVNGHFIQFNIFLKNQLYQYYYF